MVIRTAGNGPRGRFFHCEYRRPLSCEGKQSLARITRPRQLLVCVPHGFLAGITWLVTRPLWLAARIHISPCQIDGNFKHHRPRVPV